MRGAVIPQRHEDDDTDVADVEPQKEHLVPLAGSLLWESLGGLFLLNLLSMAIVVPVLVIGLVLGLIPALVLSAFVVYPTFVGMMGGIAARMRYEPGAILRHYQRTVRRSGLSAVGLGLLFHVCIYSYLLTTAQLNGDGARPSGVSALWLVQSFLLVLVVIVLIYALPLLALYGMSVRLALRNSLLLAIVSPLMAIGMVGLVILLGAAVVYIGPGMWLIVPPLAAVFFVANCHLQIEKVEARSGEGQGTARQ